MERYFLNSRFMEFANLGGTNDKVVARTDSITSTFRPITVDEVLADEKLLKQVNEDGNRVHLTGYELDGVVQVSVAKSLLISAAKKLEKYGKDTQSLGLVKSSIGFLRRGIKSMAEHMDFEQVAATQRNVETAEITITPHGSIGQNNTICMNSSNIRAICYQALKSCDFCSCSDAESRDCPVRRAFDTIPGMKLRKSNLSGTGCPYQLVSGGEWAE